MIKLTPRETVVFELVANGLCYADVAKAMHSTEAAIRSVARDALRENHCANRTELVAKAIRCGALDQGRYGERKQIRDQWRDSLGELAGFAA